MSRPIDPCSHSRASLRRCFRAPIRAAFGGGLLVALAPFGAGCAPADPDDPDAPTPAERPDVLILVLDTTSAFVVDEAMPNTRALLDDSLQFTHAISPGNSTDDGVASLMSNSFIHKASLEQTATVNLANRFLDAGWSTVVSSANDTLSQPFYQRGFQIAEMPADAQSPGQIPDAAQVARFLETWAATPSPRFGWLQLMAGHDYRNGDFQERFADHAPRTEEELADAWTSYTADSAETDALIPQVVEAAGDGWLVLTADHGELNANFGSFVIPDSPLLGHGLGASALEVHVPLGLRGPGVSPRVYDGAVSTLDIHSTLARRVAGADVPGGDLVDGADLRPAITSACWLGGHHDQTNWLAAITRADGEQILHNSGNVGLPEEIRWRTEDGVGFAGDWVPAEEGDVSDGELEVLTGAARPACMDFAGPCAGHAGQRVGWLTCE